MDRHLFLISHAAWDACSYDEAKATCDALAQINCLRLPYPEVHVHVTLADLLGHGMAMDHGAKAVSVVKKGDNQELPISLEVKLLETGEHSVHFLTFSGIPHRVVNGDVTFGMKRKNGADYDVVLSRERIIAHTKAKLITLLIAKNAEKNTVEDKLCRLGIGKKKHRFRYITRIDIDRAALDAERGQALGRTIRPHLRRGHIRSQRFGPELRYAKQVFIEPVFVNADSDFVETRRHYAVSKTLETHNGSYGA